MAKKKKAVYEVSEPLTKLLYRIVDKFHNDFPNIQRGQVIVLKVSEVGKSKYLGRCRAITEPWATTIRFSSKNKDSLYYIIEVNHDRIEHFGFYEGAQERLKLLLFHELKHIPREGTVVGSPEFKQIVKHDTEEFISCLRIAGVNGPIMWEIVGDIPDILKIESSDEDRLKEEDIAQNFNPDPYAESPTEDDDGEEEPEV